MQSLLRWSIENSEAGAAQQPVQREKLDSEIIDMILGKPDSELMKEALAIAIDEKRDEDDRLQALDNFEMLIESIDNANDLVKLKMWEPIHNLLISPSSSEEIKAQTLWIIGTAVQNNPAAQCEYLAFSPMSTLLSFLSPGIRSAKTRSKAVYALSGLLKHSAPAVKQMQEAGGWKTFRAALQDPDIAVRRKTAFLLNALLVPTGPVHPQSSVTSQSDERSVIVHPDATVHQAESTSATVHPNSHASMLADPLSFSTSPLTLRAIKEEGLLQGLIDSLTSPVPHGPDGESEGDPDFESKVVSVLHTYVMSCHGQLSPQQKKAVSGYLQTQSEKIASEHELAEKWGMSTDEVRLFMRTLEG